jgi:hypothetical protein
MSRPYIAYRLQDQRDYIKPLAKRELATKPPAHAFLPRICLRACEAIIYSRGIKV